MKKLFAIIGVCFIFTAIFAVKNTEIEKENRTYPQTLKVINIENDIVTLENATGYIFQFEGAEDWMIGDFCSCVMDSKNTDLIFDDEILEKRYSGFYEESN